MGLRLILVGLLILLTWPIDNRGAIAQGMGYRQPDVRNFPGRREGGGTRGAFIPVDGVSLTALVPEDNFGATLSSHPTLFFYIPEGLEGSTLELVLTDETEQEFYEVTSPVSQAGGIIAIPLPPDSPALEVGILYHWTLAVVINPDDRTSDLFVDGWIQRIEANSALTDSLNQAREGDRPQIYANAGIWYDTLTALANLRRTHADDQTLIEDWSSLLNSVGLSQIAERPLLNPGELSSPQQESLLPRSAESNSTSSEESRGFFLPPDLRVSPSRQGGGSR